MWAKIDTSKNGQRHARWILKRKFGMALLALAGAFYIAWSQGSSLGEWTAFSTMLLGLIFAADITDKKLNGGAYHATTETGDS